MRFRQVHLDFHTSELIDSIGTGFSKAQFQANLIKGHVDSITIFSKCHHGWAYHPSKANTTHPGLGFDLLSAMIEAAHEINVKVPIYISAGLDEKLARQHPDWLLRNSQDQTSWVVGFMAPGYHEFCFNSPYLEVLLKQIEETVTNYDGDGIFLDIVGERECYCQFCISELRSNGHDPRDKKAVKALGQKVYANYTTKVKELVHAIKPNYPIFHNGGHILRGRRDVALMNTHLELESLPTGGWGYDHFPLSARYAQTLGMEFLGMTGKFHTSWGEFGGYKHDNALRYEVALSLANGAKCSIGDQLHPSGRMDEATYELIGTAYAEVEQKEAWCTNVTNVADVALLSLEAVYKGEEQEGDEHSKVGKSDVGAVRMLLEGNILFDVVDLEADFMLYKVIILPDNVLINSELAAKLRPFLNQGGKLLATGKSGLNSSENQFALELGVAWRSPNPYQPDYFRPNFDLPNLRSGAYVFYGKGQKIDVVEGGLELGTREDPYFNRDIFTFSSHQHAPNRVGSTSPGMVESNQGIYIAWHIFEDYATKGSLILKETVLYALNRLLSTKTLVTNLPAQGVTTLQYQASEKRYINHLLYASPVKRGTDIEIIEDIIPLHNIEVTLRLQSEAKRVYLAPQGIDLDYVQNEQGLTYTIRSFECHQMVVIDI
ncbi:beta-galactosidase trimerization domain-containing protein [Paenibacillus roseipurpureus]|uniref:Beta-galactosidase trimerization domain-containing protein n=1 Tax=Paenibacillus roseopurpureus TaxID=2918901 RepID=A0AA96LQH6_9BACL|nr:beta-galactosidase trimerization domain-containing protein [Paenibacillus sp. MBLB1832]WNR45299.1 beta-galactosidase trimerization domain-containing protein [Paenibacillus sp. MBLB1832]